MTINQLTLFNFGVYAGENTFVFHNQKSIVLIGGMNGRGKTTVLEATLLSLYGAASYAFSESKYRSYGQYLKAFVNRADGSMDCYVELQFQLDKTTPDRYSIRRQWSGAAEKVRETVQVKKNGTYSQFLTDNWAIFIENILPSGLSNFFFLDGEKIAELALERTNARMKESIKALLGISVLERLDSDLTRIISKADRNESDAIDATEVEEMKARKEQKESALQALDERIEDISTKCAQLDQRLKETNTEYLSQGGDLAARQQELFEQRAALQTRSTQIQEQLVNLASGALPLRLLRDSLTRIQTQAEKERDYQTSIQAVEKMRSILGNYLEGNAHDENAIRAFIQYMEERTENDHVEMIYHLSERGMSQINGLLSSGLDSSYTQTVALISEERKNRDKSDEIDHYLSIDWNERTLGQIYRKIQSLEAEKAKLEEQLETE